MTSPVPTTQPGAPATPPISVAEIASFTPDSPTQQMEPAGWTAVGLETNFIAHASAHVRSGSLFGRPAEVRFTPVRYDWSYGNGDARQSATPGASWQSLGLPEFSPTATSHVYRVPGRYTTRLTVQHTAEYRLGSSGWIAVHGTILVPANDLEVAVLRPRSVLVAEHCTVDTRAPGC